MRQPSIYKRPLDDCQQETFREGPCSQEREEVEILVDRKLSDQGSLERRKQGLPHSNRVRLKNLRLVVPPSVVSSTSRAQRRYDTAFTGPI